MAIVKWDAEANSITVTYDGDLNEKNTYGQTALMNACWRGDVKLVKLLINKGANLDISDRDGFTALMTVCWPSNLEIAKLLIDKGANLDIQNNYDRQTVLLRSCKCENIELTSYILEHI